MGATRPRAETKGETTPVPRAGGASAPIRISEQRRELIPPAKNRGASLAGLFRHGFSAGSMQENKKAAAGDERRRGADLSGGRAPPRAAHGRWRAAESIHHLVSRTQAQTAAATRDKAQRHSSGYKACSLSGRRGKTQGSRRSEIFLNKKNSCHLTRLPHNALVSTSQTLEHQPPNTFDQPASSSHSPTPAPQPKPPN